MSNDTTPFGDFDDATAEALMAGDTGVGDPALGELAEALAAARLLAFAPIPEAVAHRHVTAAARLASRSRGAQRWVRRAVAVGMVGVGIVGGAAAARHALFNPTPTRAPGHAPITAPEVTTPATDEVPPTSADVVGPGATVDLDTCLADPAAGADSSARECNPTSGGEDLPAPVSTIPPVDPAQVPPVSSPEQPRPKPSPSPSPQPTAPPSPGKPDKPDNGDDAGRDNDDQGDNAGGGAS